MAGKVLSSCGVWVQNLAAAVLMWELTRSTLMVALVSMVQFAGPLLLSLFTGAMTDRVDRRRLLITGRLVSGSAVVTLALALAARGVDGFGGPPALLATVAALGIGQAISSPAMQALIPSLVADADLEPALALNAAAPSIARTVGPALGAGLLVAGGPALAFAAAGAGHLSFAATLLRIRGRPRQRPAERPRLLGGVAYLRGDRRAAAMLLGVALLGFGADPVVTLTPELADRLGGDGAVVGLLATGFGVGAVAQTLSFGWVRSRVSLRGAGTAGFALLAAGLLAAAASPSVPAATASFVVAGAGFMLGTVVLNTRIQRRVPDELRGRVMALWGVAFFGSRPLAALVNGSVAEAVSLPAALAVAAALCLAALPLARVRYGPTRP